MSVVLLVGLLSTGCIGPFKRQPTPMPVALRIADTGMDLPALETLLAAFHAEYPHITVKITYTGGPGMIMTHLVDGGAADIIRATREAFEFAEEGKFVPLNELLGDDWTRIYDEYYEGVWEALSLDGVQYGVPAGLDLFVSYVNTDALFALGLPDPPDDWTLDEFLSLANDLNHPEGMPGGGNALVGCCTNYYDIDPVIFIYLYGGRIVNDLQHPTMPTLDDPQTIAAIKWYSGLFNRYRVAPRMDVLQETFTWGLPQAVISGYCGTWLGWYSNRGGQQPPVPWTMAWRMMPLPKNESTFELGDVEGYYINGKCEHPREALLLLRYLADRVEAAGNLLPPRKSLVNSGEYQRQVGADVAATARRFSERVLMVPYQESDALVSVGGVLIQAIGDIVQQDLDPADVLPEAQRQSIGLLD